MKKIILFTIFFCASAGVIFLTGCSRTAPKKNAAPPVTVAKAFETNVPVEIDPAPVGHVTPISTVAIHSQIGGIIQKINFKEGEEVQSNALLFSVDPRPSQAALDQARANLGRDAGQLEYQKANFARDQKLFTQKIISQDQVDTDTASRDAAIGTVAADKAAITNAELNLEFCEIRAPFDGVTGSLQLHIGDVVKAPDDTLITINQLHPIYVNFAVPEEFLPEIKKQMAANTLKVSVTYENMTVRAPRGNLTFIDNSVDETTGTILLKATFANEDKALWPGQFVQVVLTLSELTNVVVVPTQAIQNGQNGPFVYVVAPDQTVQMQPVKTGITFENKTVVQSGLNADETVVTDGQLRLAPKMKVSVKTNDAGRMQNVETNDAN